MSHSTEQPEKARRRFIGSFFWRWLGVLSGGASAVWAMYQEIAESVRQEKLGALPYWFFAYLCVIFVAWLICRDMKSELNDLTKQLGDKNAKETRRKLASTVQVWISEGERLISKIEMTSGVGSEEVGQNCAKWLADAELFAENQIQGFYQEYVAAGRFPPPQDMDGPQLTNLRAAIFVMVARLKETHAALTLD